MKVRRVLSLLLVLLAWPVVAHAKPQANFQADPRRGEVPLDVQFTNTSSPDAVKFFWDFGDGATSSEEHPRHVFTTPSLGANQFRVALTVADAAGETSTKDTEVTVDGPTLVAALLPVSRSVAVGQPATAFLTVINAGHVTATAVRVEIESSLAAPPVDFAYQATDPATNAVVGAPNPALDIAAGASQSYLIVATPKAPLPATDMRLDIGGSNTTRDARKVSGLNTLLLSASSVPTPDVVAVALTPDANGILTVAGSGAFAVATANVGAGGAITATVDTNGVALPLALSICRTDPGGGQCASAAEGEVLVDLPPGATPTFAVFAAAQGPVPYDPETRRIFVRFIDGAGTVRGATSVAVKTP